MDEIDQIRRVLPGWPSELDAAKAPSNWLAMAQSFFSAAIVLDQENTSAQQAMHAGDGCQVGVDLLRRQQTSTAAIFCLAFSLELAIKGALVQQGKLDGLSHQKNLTIAHHSLIELANQIDGFTTDSETENLLQWASNMVLGGKYPTSKKPSDLKDGVPVVRQFRELLDVASPVYECLMAICAQSSPPDA